MRARLLLVMVVFGAGCADDGRTDPRTNPGTELPGNPDGTCTVPADAMAEDTSTPDHVIGDGTPASCTSAAVVAAVAQGGVITFDCGPDPITITLTETAKIRNDTGPEIVIDGGGRVTLSGAGARRILYMNTCDQAQVWTTSHCDDQDHPRLTVQNLTFVDGYDGGRGDHDGGGAIFVRGGRLKVLNSRFYNNQCYPSGSDLGGGAIRAFDQSQDLPLYVVDSTFGGAGEGLGNSCANGGALSSIGVSWTVLNSVFANNSAVGHGANDGNGGNGGAIYNDGNPIHLRVCGTAMNGNVANEGGGAIFFVSNDRSGTIAVQNSVLRNNPSLEFSTSPGFFVIAASSDFSGSTIE